jgi:hypothetical protein
MNNVPRANHITESQPLMVSFNNTFNNLNGSAVIDVGYQFNDLAIESKQYVLPSPGYIDATTLLAGLNANLKSLRSANAVTVFQQNASTGAIELKIDNTPNDPQGISKVTVYLFGKSIEKIFGTDEIVGLVASPSVTTTIINLGVPNFAPTDVIYVQMEHLANNSLTELGTETTKNILCAIPMGKYARGTNVHWEPSCTDQYLHKYPRPLTLDKSIKITLLNDNFEQIDPPNGSHIDVIIKTTNNLLIY